MESLYNKIYNAINESIQQALLVDDDVSINYLYSKIDNKVDTLLMEFVDLGLPSGTLWCEHNLGAICNKDVSSWYGDYYAWGETEIKNIYTQENYKHPCDDVKEFDIEFDIVNKQYSSKYPHLKVAKLIKIPTEQQCSELLKNTDCIWQENYNGVDNLNGALLISKINNKSIFIPAAGYSADGYFICKRKICYLQTNTNSEQVSRYSNEPNKYTFFLQIKKDERDVKAGQRWSGLSVRGVIQLK